MSLGAMLTCCKSYSPRQIINIWDKFRFPTLLMITVTEILGQYYPFVHLILNRMDIFTVARDESHATLERGISPLRLLDRYPSHYN